MTEPISSSYGKTVRNALLGALIASGLTVPLYWLSQSIISAYADKPLPDSNQMAMTISVAVRTLVMGGSILFTALFVFVAIGLLLLALQTALQWLRNGSHESAVNAEDKE